MEITGNRFSEIKGLAVKAGGVRELTVENNVFDTEKPISDIIRIS